MPSDVENGICTEEIQGENSPNGFLSRPSVVFSSSPCLCHLFLRNSCFPMSDNLETVVQVGQDMSVQSHKCALCQSLKRSCALQYGTQGIPPWITTRRAVRADNVLFVQYYALANSTVLVYDYFLTLSDEVGRDYPPSNPFLKPLLIQG